MIPKAMQFTAAAESTGYKSGSYPGRAQRHRGSRIQHQARTESRVQESRRGRTRRTSGSRRSGTRARTKFGRRSTSPGAQATNRPGGGLGPPIDAPDPLQKYRWQILGGIAAALILGGVYVAVRQQSAARALARQTPGSSTSATMVEDDYAPAETNARAPAPPPCCSKD